MDAAVESIVVQSLQKAQEHDAAGNVGRAYAYYTAVVELCPPQRSKVEKAFTDVLCEWGMELESKNRVSDVSKCYKHSLKNYPKNSRMLNNFAAHLLRNEEPLKAIVYLNRALEADPNFLPAERNLQNAYSMAVDRWHFSMLNDKSRNSAFQQAIKKRISLGYDTVLDIGTGTGLLSLYAQKGGAKKVYACECSSVMSDIANQVFQQNKSTDISLFCKASTELKIPEDIPERVKLIVTEIFDAALFGELVLPTLLDAHENLLAKNGAGIIIPMNATLYIAAVECDYIQFKSSANLDGKNYARLLNFENVEIRSDEDFYDTENLENVHINYITEPREILNVNFNNPSELRSLSEDGIKEVLWSTCRYDGSIDGLVAWFKLHLDEEITIDSSQGNSCWQLAVFPTDRTNLKKGSAIRITAEVVSGKLKCSYKCEENDSRLLEKPVYHLPSEIITFLNDNEYTESLAQIAISKRTDRITTVLDTCPFPIYGLALLKENESCEVLYYQTDNLALKHLIERIIDDSNIDGKVFFVSGLSEIFCPVDTIFMHNFDPKGELIDYGQQSCQELYRCLLRPSGDLLPERIFLMGQLVYSEDLSKMTTVKDSNVQNYSSTPQNFSKDTDDDEDDSENLKIEVSNGEDSNFRIAEYINEYKINQVFDLNSSLYIHEVMSDEKILVEMDEPEVREQVINFGKIEPIEGKPLPNALICWYKINLKDDHIHDTRRTHSFMNHMAVVLEDELKDCISQGKDIQINVYQMRDLIRISLI